MKRNTELKKKKCIKELGKGISTKIPHISVYFICSNKYPLILWSDLLFMCFTFCEFLSQPSNNFDLSLFRNFSFPFNSYSVFLQQQNKTKKKHVTWCLKKSFYNLFILICLAQEPRVNFLSESSNWVHIQFRE